VSLPVAGPGTFEGLATGIEVAGAACLADASGALVLPGDHTLVVADLHLGKGAAVARRGPLLPPYDTHATLMRLAGVIARIRPRRVISLGDAFHDEAAPALLDARALAMLRGLQRGRDWIWIAGNHDPRPPAGCGGEAAAALDIGRLVLRHEPHAGPSHGEIAGHLHPVARIRGGGPGARRRCFAFDGNRLILPAFGAYAGGLNVLDPAVAGLFTGHRPQVAVLGRERVYRIGRDRLVGD
jgi:DNA ligase-associated metallophosphoesterase